MTAAEEIVDELMPEDGWWKSDTQTILVVAADTMLHNGMSQRSTLNLLSRIVSAIRSEYGE